MRKATLFIILSILACAFALQKPTNYFAGDSTFAVNGGIRGNQQQAADFAIWNATSGDWANVLPPRLSGGTLYGIVSVGTGLLAYGGFTCINGNPAAGLAYYDGNVWAAPEGVGLYSLGGFVSPNYNSSYSYYDNIPSGTGIAYAAVVDTSNNVYIYGSFDQVGLCRTGVAGFVQLQWSSPGLFAIKQIGNGYYKTITTVPPSAPCTFCVGDSPPSPVFGNINKMRYYKSSSSGNLVFVFQQCNPGDLWQWEVNTPNWVQITAGNGATNLTGVINDFDIPSGSNNIFVVGNFQRMNDPNSQLRYQHIAVSTNNGISFCAFGPTLNQTMFGSQSAVYNSLGITIQPAYTAVGFYAIAAVPGTTNQVWVAGGVRDGYRQSGQGDAYPNESATRIFSISSTTGVASFSERFGPYDTATTATNTPAQMTSGPTIDKLQVVSGNLYAFGPFQYYRQIATVNIRYGTRYTYVMKGAAVLNIASGTWAPAFGGFLTTSTAGDLSPRFSPSSSFFLSAGSVSGNTLFYFAGTSTIASTYGILSGAMFAYGGDPLNNANNKWNVIYGNNRFVTLGTAANPPSPSNLSSTTSLNFAAQPYGNNGQVRSLLVVAANDALIFGGNFDYIGNMQVPSVGFWNQDLGTIGSVGGGLFYYNNVPFYQSDSMYNNRVGGVVNDLTEYNNYLYAAGNFNRNNSGSALANIAAISYRTGGAGWIQVDGGCDSTINDLYIQNGLLYATGGFAFCGLNSAGFNQGDGLFRGRVPTSGIAVIDLTLDPSVQSWRPLGIGLQGGAGLAMTYRRGYLYVGGSFMSAGGVLNSKGIAKWDGNAWTCVVANCRGPCDRPVNVLPYIGTAIVPDALSRRPPQCSALSTIQGNVWCIDTAYGSAANFQSGNLAWFDGSTWYRAGALTVQTGTQNSVIVNNQSRTSNILVPASGTYGANGNFFYSWGTGTNNFEPSFTGFSSRPTALAAGSLVVVSQILVILCLLVSFVFFF